MFCPEKSKKRTADIVRSPAVTTQVDGISIVAGGFEQKEKFQLKSHQH